MLFVGSLFAANATVYKQISSTAKVQIASGSGVITAIWADQDITTRVTDVFIYDAGNTYTARTDANTLFKLICEANQGWKLLYEGKVYPVSGFGESKFSGIPFTNGIVGEAATSTINAVIEYR